jgi:hypothetical protein
LIKKEELADARYLITENKEHFTKDDNVMLFELLIKNKELDDACDLITKNEEYFDNPSELRKIINRLKNC